MIGVAFLLWRCGQVTPKTIEQPFFEKRYDIIPPQKKDIEARLTAVTSDLSFVDFLQQQGGDRTVSYYTKLSIPAKVDRYCRIQLENNFRDSIYIVSRDSIVNVMGSVNYFIDQDKKEEMNEVITIEPLQFAAIKYVQNLLLPGQTKTFYLLYPNKVDSMSFQIGYLKFKPSSGNSSKVYPYDFLLVNDKQNNKMYVKPED
ncbi:MAG TPA: hypothetical protein DCS93_15070 [Microscillaceae bacterium]|nr:hypothetical protein [Microscillaceae bacterium]